MFFRSPVSHVGITSFFSLLLAGSAGLSGVTGGNYFPPAADGCWLTLALLAKGNHEIVIHVRGQTPYFGLIAFVLIQHINVARAGHDRDCHERVGR